MYDDHICYIDCKPITVYDDAGNVIRRSHVMYSSDPTPHAGRYQNAVNLTLDRRGYRASGQDESRNVRIWNHRRRLYLDMGIEFDGPRKQARKTL